MAVQRPACSGALTAAEEEAIIALARRSDHEARRRCRQEPRVTGRRRGTGAAVASAEARGRSCRVARGHEARLRIICRCVALLVCYRD
ncbi:hypothetical protein GUJ93_ZPchr0001g29523 [Zizania palustris]|uniref:Uncharacterized protein n=1 Tax=Zizania palustris TaxID=103762 RepID=A0A8J5S0C4_ZIZPA|nr:hypothetical protein GUJ93_ZPchr0001g29523 [Zizania palustris]